MALASAELERMLIKGLISGGVLHEGLSANDFQFYKPIYDAIVELKANRKTVDFANVFPKVDFDALNECVHSNGYAASVDEYAKQLHDLTKRRSILTAIQTAEVSLNGTIDTCQVVDDLRDVLLRQSETKDNWRGIQSVMDATTLDLINKIKNKKGNNRIIACELATIDNLTGGFFKGELTVIGARPAVGKSAFALHIAYHAALKGFSVGILSREMSETQFGSRLVAKASQINGMKLRTGDITDDEMCDIQEAADILSKLDINFLFNVRTVEDLQRQVLARSEIKPLDILIVDYLQLMDTTKTVQSDSLRVGAISRGLKDITLDYQIPVIALAQVNRDAENTMPTLGKLKDSGSIEQDADNVIFMYAPDSADSQYVHPNDKGSFEAWKAIGLDYIVFNIAKQRQGRIGKVPILFDRSHMDYRCIE